MSDELLSAPVLRLLDRDYGTAQTLMASANNSIDRTRKTRGPSDYLAVFAPATPGISCRKKVTRSTIALTMVDPLPG